MFPASTTARRVSTALRWSWRLFTWPVWNRRRRRLRAPVRAILPLVITFLALAAVQSAVRAQFDHPVVEPVEAVGLLVVLVGGVLVSARLIDRRPVAEYGLSFDRRWWRSVAVGGAIATAVNAGASAAMLATGWASVAGFAEGSGSLPFWPAMVVVFPYIAVAASWEEFVLRGTMLKNIAEGSDGYLPRWAAVGVAVLVSSLVFAFLHGGKVTHLGQYGYYVVAGVVLGVAYVLTGELALSIGFHVCYNFTMSAVFGLGVTQQTPELVVLDIVGPTRWVGEEGLVHLIFAVLGGVCLVAYVRHRDGSLRLDDGVTRWTPIFDRETSREPSGE